MSSFKTIAIGLLVVLTVVYFAISRSLFSQLPGINPFPNKTDLKGRAMYVLGDSTVDAGNFPIVSHPYGLDWKNNAPGRFTNGRTIADLLAEKIATPIPRAYNSLGAEELKKNVNINFATAGCGLLTTTHPIPCTSMADQVIQLVNSQVSSRKTAVYFVSVGANDFIFPFHGQIIYTCGGARLFVVNNLASIGCIPDKTRGLKQCNLELNKAVEKYNHKLEVALKKFGNDYGATVWLADSHRLFNEIRASPYNFGFTEVFKPCCGGWNEKEGRFNCINGTGYCPDRKEHLFFDGAHTTEAANQVFVEKCLSRKVCYTV